MRAMCQLHSWRNDDACFGRDENHKLYFYSTSSLNQESKDRDVAQPEPIILNPSQSFVSLLIAAV